MTDQFTSLSPAAIKSIIANLDQSIAVFGRHSGRMTAAEIQVKSMLSALRRQLLEQLDKKKE